MQLVKVDMTDNEQIHVKDLSRVDRKNLPVNLIYPPDYPNRPAILLEEVIWANNAVEALERVSPPESVPNNLSQRAVAVQ